MPRRRDRLKRNMRLPLAPRPYPHELIFSWQSRVSAGFGLHASMLDALLREEAGWPESVIANAGEGVAMLELWARAARLDPARLDRMRLLTYWPARPDHWFLKVGAPVFNRLRVMPPVCLSCLREDACAGRDMYVRANWMRAELCLCPRHGEVLVETCAKCQADLAMHFIMHRSHLLLACSRCGAVLGNSKQRGKDAIPPGILQAQDQVTDRLNMGLFAELDATADWLWGRWSRERSSPEIDRWMINKRRWHLMDRNLVGSTNAFACLSVAARSAMLPFLAAGTMAAVEPMVRVVSSSRTITSESQTRTSQPIHLSQLRSADEYRVLADRLLSDPRWCVAASLSPLKRQRAENKLIDQALGARVIAKSDSSEHAKASVQ